MSEETKVTYVTQGRLVDVKTNQPRSVEMAKWSEGGGHDTAEEALKCLNDCIAKLSPDYKPTDAKDGASAYEIQMNMQMLHSQGLQQQFRVAKRTITAEIITTGLRGSYAASQPSTAAETPLAGAANA